MSFTVTAFNQQEWERHGLADYGDFTDRITECNVGDLVSCLGDDDLVRCLENEGVKDLRIDDADLSESWWGYDASLVDGGDVRDTIDEGKEATDEEE